jgi:GGDEF domain-containing protein
VNGIPTIMIALATVCTATMIGLGFLQRPSRESAIWSAAFIAPMASTYVEGGTGPGDAPWLEASGDGLMFLAVGMVWVGIRVRRGRRQVLLVPTIAVAVVLVFTLALADGTMAEDAVGMGELLLFATISATTAVELVGMRNAPRAVTVPLALSSGLISLFALLWLCTDFVDDRMRLLGNIPAAQDYTPVVTAITLVTALTTLLLLTRAEIPASAHAPLTGFRAIARDRLDRAERFDDAWWSLLDVRLDDPAVLREASSTQAFTHVLDRFASDVSAVFPAEADLDRVTPARMLVLLPRHEAAVRPLLRALLERVATVSSDQSIAVRLSASIGWASVSRVGYDLDDLIAAAASAADEAQVSGGDRWERASVVV